VLLRISATTSPPPIVAAKAPAAVGKPFKRGDVVREN